jgi:hypothetical protein
MGSFDACFMPCFVDHGFIRCTKSGEEPFIGFFAVFGAAK